MKQQLRHILPLLVLVVLMLAMPAMALAAGYSYSFPVASIPPISEVISATVTQNGASVTVGGISVESAGTVVRLTDVDVVASGIDDVITKLTVKCTDGKFYEGQVGVWGLLWAYDQSSNPVAMTEISDPTIVDPETPVGVTGYFHVVDQNNQPMSGYHTAFYPVDEAYNNPVLSAAGTTDSNGRVSLNISGKLSDDSDAPSFGFSVSVNGSRYEFEFSRAQVTASTEASPLEVMVETQPQEVTQKYIEAQSNVYLNGTLYKTSDTSFTVSSDVKLANHIGARVLFEGVADCTAATMSVNGAAATNVPHGNPSTSTPPYYVAVSEDANAATLYIDPSLLDDGDKVVANFYYEYTDADHEYNITVNHNFYVGTTLLSTESSSHKAKAGDPITFDAQTSLTNRYIRKNIPNYTGSVFYLADTLVTGGKPNSILGSYSLDDGDIYSCSDTMVHQDTTIDFNYYYVYGNVEIKVIVSGYAHNSTYYPLTLTVDDPTLNGTFGDVTFVNGVAELSMQGNTIKTAVGLPAGVKYTVMEATGNEYHVIRTNNIGTIPSDSRMVKVVMRFSIDELPQTGDNAHPTWYAVLWMVAAAGMIALLSRKRSAAK